MRVVLRLLSCLLALTSLRKLKGANAGNRTRPNAHVIPPADKDCAGYDLDGKIYNLAALGRKDGKPRFWVVSRDWNYTYNPCRPFSQGTTQTSDCFGDVAVCMGTKNKARYQLIGTQSSFHYGFNKKTNTPQLVYNNKESFPNRQVIVDFKCDPSKKTPEEALFEFISDTKGIWRFLVTSICSCPDGCPSDPDDPSSHTGESSGELKYRIPVITALSFLCIAIPLFIYRRTIWRCIRRQNDPNNEHEALNPENIRNDYAANHIIEGDDAPRPSSAGLRSGSNDPRDNINNELSRARHGNREVLGALA